MFLFRGRWIWSGPALKTVYPATRGIIWEFCEASFSAHCLHFNFRFRMRIVLPVICSFFLFSQQNDYGQVLKKKALALRCFCCFTCDFITTRVGHIMHSLAHIKNAVQHHTTIHAMICCPVCINLLQGTRKSHAPPCKQWMKRRKQQSAALTR